MRRFLIANLLVLVPLTSSLAEVEGPVGGAMTEAWKVKQQLKPLEKEFRQTKAPKTQGEIDALKQEYKALSKRVKDWFQGKLPAAPLEGWTLDTPGYNGRYVSAQWKAPNAGPSDLAATVMIRYTPSGAPWSASGGGWDYTLDTEWQGYPAARVHKEFSKDVVQEFLVVKVGNWEFFVSSNDPRYKKQEVYNQIMAAFDLTPFKDS